MATRKTTGGKSARKRPAATASKGAASARTTKKTTRAASGSGAAAKKASGTRISPKAAAAAKKKTDRKTTERIETLAGSIVKTSLSGRDPFVDIPTRALSNTKWNRSRRILQMGNATQRRNLFNLNQAKKFMQTMLIADGCRSLIEAEKTLSLRGMYYKTLHTIAGTKEKTFADQSESDPIIEDLEVSLGALREELHVFASERGKVVGNLTIVDGGDEIDLRRMGTGGYAIPSIVEPSVIQFGKCEAKFILHVEKGTVWARFNEDKFWKTHNCILTEGGGQPPRGVRRLLRRMHDELGLPVYCLLDCDPWGHYIYSVIKQGSMSLAFESDRMAVPDARFIGIRADDYERCGLSDDVQIALTDRDVSRAKQIAGYPWFKDKRAWQREIKTMLANGFKMEVESLITKDISYVTEEYVPQRLADGDFMD